MKRRKRRIGSPPRLGVEVFSIRDAGPPEINPAAWEEATGKTEPVPIVEQTDSAEIKLNELRQYLEKLGLDLDPLLGLSSQEAAREVPSGLGILDIQPGAKRDTPVDSVPDLTCPPEWPTPEPNPGIAANDK